MNSLRKRTLRLAAIGSAAALALTGCTTSSGGGGDEDSSVVTVGTTDKVTKLDPAGSYDNGSYFVMYQVFPFLMESVPGSAEVQPGIAASAEFTEPTIYEVTLKEGLTYANGNELTSSDVKFSFDRQLSIADPSGPSSMLGNLESVETPDDLTVEFHLRQGDDQTFPLVLAGPAGPIVDEDVFSADEITDDQAIVDGDAFAGPYTIDSYQFNELISYQKNPDYQGSWGEAQNDTVQMTYYADSNNLKLAVQNGDVDVAWRSLTATDVEDLEGNDSLAVHHGPGGEIRYIVFNFDTQPFGAETDDADEDKALAVRQAAADLIDREALSEDIYKGTYTPLYSYVPEGLAGASDSLQGLYGDGQGGPDAERAEERLSEADVDTPVELNIQYSPDHYGPSSADEYARVKDQLESSGLFTVNLQSTEWVQYAEQFPADGFPVYQLGWFPDYSDADNYLVPFFYNEGDRTSFLNNHYIDEEVNGLLDEQISIEDPEDRAAVITEIQDRLAEDVPTLPLLQGQQIAVSGSGVQGVEDTLDPSFQFRLGLLTK